jgi:hypothetical protein
MAIGSATQLGSSHAPGRARNRAPHPSPHRLRSGGAGRRGEPSPSGLPPLPGTARRAARPASGSLPRFFRGRTCSGARRLAEPPRLGAGRLWRFARGLWRFARRLWLGVGGRCGLRRCFSFLRPLPGVTRHVVQALGDVPRGRRHLVQRVRRLPPDLPPRLVQQALQPLLVLLNPGKIIAALLGHTHGLPRPTPATQPGRAPREPGNGCHRARSAKPSMWRSISGDSGPAALAGSRQIRALSSGGLTDQAEIPGSRTYTVALCHPLFP